MTVIASQDQRQRRQVLLVDYHGHGGNIKYTPATYSGISTQSVGLKNRIDDVKQKLGIAFAKILYKPFVSYFTLDDVFDVATRESICMRLFYLAE